MAPKNNLKLVPLFTAAIFFAFCALAGSAEAATYYIDSSGGNDSWTGMAGARAGTTTTGPWKTVGKVNGFSFQSGDDVYFKRGQKWLSGARLTVDWSGTASDRVIIGAYDNGNAPVIDGGLTNGTTWTSGDPAVGTYNGLVVVNGKYVTVQDLRLQNSGGFGIRLVSSSGETNNIVQRCSIYRTYMSGIGNNNQINTKILDNTIDLVSLTRLVTNTYGAAIAFVVEGGGVSKNNYAAHNTISRSHGEGIDILKGTTNTVAEYNIVQNTRSVALYFDRGIHDSAFNHNLVYCAATPNEGSEWLNYGCSRAMVWADEALDLGASSNNAFFGNMVFGYRVGMNVQGLLGVGDLTISGMKVYNNTIVNSTEYNISLGNSNKVVFSSPSYIKNNIFYCTGDAGYCTTANSTEASKTNLLWDNNLFYGGTIDADTRGSHDVLAVPRLFRSSGWTIPAVPLHSLTGREFAILSNSPAIDKGTDLGDVFDGLLDLDLVNFLLDTVSLADQDINGSAWDIGADVYATGGDSQAPAQPGGLTVR